LDQAEKKYPDMIDIRGGICRCLREDQDTCNGFGWINKDDLDEMGLDKYLEKYINIIYQIDITTSTVIGEYKRIEHIETKYPDINRVRERVVECLRGDIKTTFNFGWIYKTEFDKIGMDKYIKDIKFVPRGDLLMDRYPQLKDEWDFEKNIDVDINTISYGSGIKVYWKCKGIDHPSWLTSVNSRTSHITYDNNDNIIRFSCGCKECYLDSIRVHDKEEKKNHIDNFVGNTNAIDIGDKNEIFIADLLEKTGLYKDIDRFGQSGDRTDIVVTLDSGIEKSIQAKTLSYSKNENSYSARIKPIYDPNMLIVMVNPEDGRYAVGFAKDITEETPTFTFFYKHSKYYNMMFTDLSLFTTELIRLIPESVDYDGIESSENVIKEFNFMQRLDEWCVAKGKAFRRNDTNGNPTDGFIDNIRIQGKFCSLPKKDGNSYGIKLKKSAGKLNGKNIKRNYSINDPFEYLVIGLGGTCQDPTKYYNMFYFIPKSYLIEHGYLQSPNCEGKGSISIVPEEFMNNHWSSQFLNVFQPTPQIIKKPTLRLL
jgi:hypothetical protein